MRVAGFGFSRFRMKVKVFEQTLLVGAVEEFRKLRALLITLELCASGHRFGC